MLAGCTASILGDPSGGSRDAPGMTAGSNGAQAGSAATGGGPGVAPQLAPQAVPKLLRVSNEEYRNIVADVLGVELDEQLFASWTPIAQVYGFDTMSESRVDAQGLDIQTQTAEALAKLALEASPLAAVCPAPLRPEAPAAGTTLSWDNCGQPLVSKLASRAFRRPLRADELAGYRSLFESSQTEAATALMPHPFYEGLTTVVQAVVLSPQLVFKPELVPGGFDAGERGYARASKLSLFFRSSVADDELLGLAQSGALEDMAQVRAQAERLLAQYQARFTRNFGGQWLDFREPVKEPTSLMLAMQQEVGDVFDQVLSSNSAPQRLIAPGAAIVNQELAAHYGLAFDAAGPAVQTIATDRRGGLLSHGFFLTRTATGSEFRRVIHRGLWTLTRLLCKSLPRLDPATLDEITESFKAIDRTLPLSEQMRIHRSSSMRCLGCHAEMDPIGLALENYDANGLWRDSYENGTPIVSDLQLYGQGVGDPMALAMAIEGSEDYRACVANKALTFALNRGPTDGELLLTKAMTEPVAGVSPSFKTIVVEAFMKSIELTEVAP